MKYSRLPLFVVALLFAAIEMRAQESPADKTTTRPRVVAAAPQVPQPAAPATLQAKPSDLGAGLPIIETDTEKKSSGPITHLTPSMIQARISDAQRMLKTRPKPTASVPSLEFVTIAALDRETGRTHFVTISKEMFLTKGAEVNTISSEGTIVNLKILRANGVNTALTLFTPDGKSLAPLTIEYPIERGGRFLELAYYTSAHPALLSKDVTRSGQSYVRNMLDLAARRLRERGDSISPQIVDVAERL